MANNDYGKQLNKLLSGEIDTSVNIEENSFIADPTTNQETTTDFQRSLGDTAGSIALQATTNPALQTQKELIRSFRQAALQRKRKEESSKSEMDAKIDNYNKQKNNFEAQLKQNALLFNKEYDLIEKHLSRVKMKLPKRLANNDRLESIDQYDESKFDEMQNELRNHKDILLKDIFNYTRWWFKRFVRFVIFLLILMAIIVTLLIAGGAFIAFLVKVFNILKDWISQIQFQWLQTVSWLGLSLFTLLIIGGIVGLFGYVIYTLFFRNKDKIKKSKEVMAKRKSELISTVFQPEGEAFNLGYISRMWIMAWAYIRTQMNI